MPIHLRPATEADVPAMAEVGFGAFHRDTDVIMRNIWPEHLQRPGHNPQIPWRAARKSGRLRDSGSVIMVAVERADGGGASESDAAVAVTEAEAVAATAGQTVSETETIVGYAWWALPGADGNIGSMAAASDEALAAVGETFPPELDREAMKMVRACLHAGEKAVFGDKGATECLELEVLAVDPKHGRRGIGRKLVQWGLERGAREQVDIFISAATPAGKPLYLANGFEEVGSITLFGVPHAVMLLKNKPQRE